MHFAHAAGEDAEDFVAVALAEAAAAGAGGAGAEAMRDGRVAHAGRRRKRQLDQVWPEAWVKTPYVKVGIGQAHPALKLGGACESVANYFVFRCHVLFRAARRS